MTDFDPDWPHGHMTRDGREARIICRDYKNHHGDTILALVNDGDRELIQAYTNSGKGSCQTIAPQPFDLINRPAPKRKVEFWLSIHSDGHLRSTKTRAEADNYRHHYHRIACLHIVREFEEGEGL